VAKQSSDWRWWRLQASSVTLLSCTSRWIRNVRDGSEVREGVRDQRVGRGYSAEVVTEEILAADSLFSSEEFLPVGCVFGSVSRGRWERRERLEGEGVIGADALQRERGRRGNGRRFWVRERRWWRRWS
jgi:hypothetical protein